MLLNKGIFTIAYMVEHCCNVTHYDPGNTMLVLIYTNAFPGDLHNRLYGGAQLHTNWSPLLQLRHVYHGELRSN